VPSFVVFPKGQSIMPVAYIDLRAGLSTPTKQLLMRSVAEAIHAAYHIEDTRVFLRESSADQTSVDGVLGSHRPICTFVVPPGLPVDAKRGLVGRVTALLSEACDLPREEVPLPSGKRVATRWVLCFFNEMTLEQAALDGQMAFENPMVLEGMEAAMQALQPRGAAQ
jgi:phenylpyruvate tautomerase PptA (4-oxalocrotonate tautomerase family)